MRNSVGSGQILRGGLLCIGVWSLWGMLFGLAHFRQDMDMTAWWKLLFAGVAPEGRLDPYPLIPWYAWMLPGIMGALLYSYRQHSSWRYFVLMRVGNGGRWLRQMQFVCFVWALSYVWIGLGVYTLWGLLFGVSINDLSSAHMHMCALASIHLCVVCIWITLIGMRFGHKTAIGAFLVLDGMTAILGGVVRSHSPWLIGSIGMWNQNSATILDWCLLLICLVSAFLFAPRLARNILEKG